jgi:hypothetical protein
MIEAVSRRCKADNLGRFRVAEKMTDEKTLLEVIVVFAKISVRPMKPLSERNNLFILIELFQSEQQRRIDTGGRLMATVVVVSGDPTTDTFLIPSAHGAE